MAAATPPSAQGTSDETVWTDPADRNLTPYRRSKLLAERAAWDFMATRRGETTLTTILPVAIFGPLRSADTRGIALSVGSVTCRPGGSDGTGP
jgi:nucleoside-diphosphate-sugar epimerase